MSAKVSLDRVDTEILRATIHDLKKHRGHLNWDRAVPLLEELLAFRFAGRAQEPPVSEPPTLSEPQEQGK